MVSKSEAKGLVSSLLKGLRRKFNKWHKASIECILKPTSIKDIQKKLGIEYYEDARKLLEKGEKEGLITSYIKDDVRYWFMEDKQLKEFVIKFYRNMKSYKKSQEKGLRMVIDIGLKLNGKEIRKVAYKEFTS